MKKSCGKTLTLSILMALLAGTVPVFAEDVTGQQVTIDQNQEGGLICGGHAMDGNALKNTLSILGSASITSKDINSSLNADNATVAGGYAENGNAISNTVNIRGTGNHEIGYIYGGFADSDSSTASGNQVTITGGTFQTHDIFGAADAITVNNNRISIGGDADITLTSTGPDGNGIYGGFTESDSSTARGNQVTFSGGTVRGAEFIAGAWADCTVDNQVTITDETLENDMLVAGGLGGDELVQGNAVSVDGKANLTVLGMAGGLNLDDRGGALGNQVAIGQDASVTAVAIGGGAAGASASQNLADIKGNVTGYLLGGGGVDGSSETAAVSGNVLNLENATLIPIQKEQAQSILNSTIGDDYEDLINALKKPGETIQAAGGALLDGGKATDNMVNLSGTMDLSKVNLYGWITPQDILTDPSSMRMGNIVTP